MTDREIELKYRVADPAVADALLRAAAIGRFEAAGEVEATELLDRFLDTGDGAFRARRHALRLRTVRDRTTLTIKGPSERVAGGAVSRLELEAIVGGDDPRGWPPSPAHELVDAIAGGRPLREIGRIAQHRRSRLVRSEET
ncbi:MAG TPA: CYTH domain-containing protein, partial [Candidatus Limnocylindrales bacterium]